MNRGDVFLLNSYGAFTSSMIAYIAWGEHSPFGTLLSTFTAILLLDMALVEYAYMRAGSKDEWCRTPRLDNFPPRWQDTPPLPSPKP